MYTVELILPPRQLILQAIEQRKSDVLQYCSMLVQKDERHLREFCSTNQLLTGLNDHLAHIGVSESWIQGRSDSLSALGSIFRRVPNTPAFAQLEIILRKCSLMVMLPHPDVILLMLQQLGMVYNAALVRQVMQAVATLITMMMESVRDRLPSARSSSLPPIPPISVSTPILTLPKTAAETVAVMQSQIKKWFESGAIDFNAPEYSRNPYQAPSMSYTMPSKSMSPPTSPRRSSAHGSRRKGGKKHRAHFKPSVQSNYSREQKRPYSSDNNDIEQQDTKKYVPESKRYEMEQIDSLSHVVEDVDSSSETTEVDDLPVVPRYPNQSKQTPVSPSGSLLRLDKRRPGSEHLLGRMVRLELSTPEEKTLLDPEHEVSQFALLPRPAIELFLPFAPTDDPEVAAFVTNLVNRCMNQIWDDELIHTLPDRILEQIAVVDTPAIQAIERKDVMQYTTTDLLVRWQTDIWKRDYARSLVDTIVHAIEIGDVKTVLTRDDMHQIAEIETNKLSLLAAPLLLEMTPLKVMKRMENHLQGVQIPPRFDRSIERRHVVEALIQEARRTFPSYIGIAYPVSVKNTDPWPGDGYLPAPPSWKARAVELKLERVNDALRNYLAEPTDVWTISERTMHDITAYLAFPGKALVATDAAEGNDRTGRILMPEKPLYIMPSVSMAPYLYGGRIPIAPPPGYKMSSAGNENLFREYDRMLKPTEIAVLKYDNEREERKRKDTVTRAVEEKQQAKQAAIERSVSESLSADPTVVVVPPTSQQQAKDNVIHDKVEASLSVDADTVLPKRPGVVPTQSNPPVVGTDLPLPTDSARPSTSQEAASYSTSVPENGAQNGPYVYPFSQSQSQNAGSTRTHIAHTPTPFKPIHPVAIETFVDHPDPDAANREIEKLQSVLKGVRSLLNQQKEYVASLLATRTTLENRPDKDANNDIRKQITEINEKITGANAGLKKFEDQKLRLIQRIKQLQTELQPKILPPGTKKPPPKPATEYKEMELDKDMPKPMSDPKPKTSGSEWPHWAGNYSDYKTYFETNTTPPSPPPGGSWFEFKYDSYQRANSAPPPRELTAQEKEHMAILEQEIKDYSEDLQQLTRTIEQSLNGIIMIDAKLDAMSNNLPQYRDENWRKRRTELDARREEYDKQYEEAKTKRGPLEQRLSDAQFALNKLKAGQSYLFYFASRSTATKNTRDEPSRGDTNQSTQPATASSDSASTPQAAVPTPQAAVPIPQAAAPTPVAPAPSSTPVANVSAPSASLNTRIGATSKPAANPSPKPILKSALRTGNPTERLPQGPKASVGFDASTKNVAEDVRDRRLVDAERKVRELQKSFEREQRLLQKEANFLNELEEELKRNRVMKRNDLKPVIDELLKQVDRAKSAYYRQEEVVLRIKAEEKVWLGTIAFLEKQAVTQKKQSS